jgi:hypothetical protein
MSAPLVIADSRYAPVTWEVGLVPSGFTEVAEVLRSWRLSLGKRCTTQVRTDDLAAIVALEPLQGSPPRELVMEATGGWSAYFNCSINGTDAASAMAWLAKELDARTFVVSCKPHGSVPADDPTYVRFTSYYRDGNGFLEADRHVEVLFDMGKWSFTEMGEPLPFEQPDRYGARLKRERLTPAMLRQYFVDLGIDLFDPNSFGPRSVVLECISPATNSAATFTTGPQAVTYLGPLAGEAGDALLIKRTITEARHYFGLE